MAKTSQPPDASFTAAPKRLGTLLSAAGLPPAGGGVSETLVTAVVDDSRHAVPGCAFVAIPGTAADGRRFIPDAVARGAALIVTEPGDLPAVEPRPLLIEVPDARLAAALLAHAFFDWPTREMFVVGVTGTNGKTTTTYLLEAVLRAAGKTVGVIGTIEGRLDSRTWPAPTTTPSPVALAQMTAEMRALGADALAMEASSHAIDQHRIAGITFDAGIFTNLSQDHLDYHGTMEVYGAVKKRFFTEVLAECPGARTVTNIDDPLGLEIASASPGPVVTYGRTPGANVRICDVMPHGGGMTIGLNVLGEDWAVESPLIGPGNVYNTAGVVALAQILELDRETIQRGLLDCARIPGRLEAIREGQDFAVLVDYSHTPASLELALRQCRELARQASVVDRRPSGDAESASSDQRATKNERRVLVVFGCGGDRDPIKRPLMGEIAAREADLVWLTTDNPRTEDPEKIAAHVIPGMQRVPRDPSGLHVELDRRRAIEAAISAAQPGDVLLIAGKGHENYQEIHGVKHHFDDAEVARECLRRNAK